MRLSLFCPPSYSARTRLTTDEGSIPVVARCILNMMKLTPKFTWQQYEQFLAEWEVMRRALFHGENVSVRGFYTPANFVGMDKQLVNSIPDDLTFEVHRKAGVKALSGHYRTCATEKDLSNVVCLPAAGNLGFDVVSLVMTPAAFTLAICVECRFSQPGAKTVLSLETVRHKHTHTVAETASSIDEVVLVVCAFRRLHSDWYKEGASVPKRTQMSGDVKMEDAYGWEALPNPQKEDFVRLAEGRSYRLRH
jgi:hypothetical protein